MSKITEKMLQDLKAELIQLREERGKKSPEVEALEKKIEKLERAAAERSGPSFTGGSDLPGAEDSFHLSRAIYALGERSWNGAEYERDVLVQAAEKKGLDVERVKAASLGSDTTLGNLIPNTVQNEVVPLIQSEMILEEMGVNMVEGLAGSPVQIPRETAEGTAYWVGENSTITASDQETDMIELRPHTIAGLSKFANKMLRAGGTGLEGFVRRSIGRTVAKGIQTGYFAGTGVAGQPLGIKNQLGIRNHGAIGTMTIAKLQAMIDNLRRDNIPAAEARWVFHPAVLASIEQLAASDTTHRQGTPVFTMGDISKGTPSRLLGLPYSMSTNIGSTTDIYLGYWPWTMLGSWGALEIAVTREAGDAFAKDQTWVRVLKDVDTALLQPTAINYGSGVTVPTLST